ncbi:MAG TPA: hypothetical protein VGU61_00055 [Noviherbaspirillum sp.]|jgi:hypothetical protein|uniref:hypothetical protein n=1 Tax=Noviherbaspirillum sp. TaxID=1926288 RepID=UPI002DDD15ED|nr:hypothetical protein [Noviherbaspirillum sp.]HEV2608628.1 hypothetical protein [Noviherbaspirillum sp.]
MEDVENNFAVVELFIRCFFIVLSIYVMASVAVIIHWLFKQGPRITAQVQALEPSGRQVTK